MIMVIRQICYEEVHQRHLFFQSYLLFIDFHAHKLWRNIMGIARDAS